jgi:hypothetical protein
VMVEGLQMAQGLLDQAGPADAAPPELPGF